jgi:hypothetical protein
MKCETVRIMREKGPLLPIAVLLFVFWLFYIPSGATAPADLDESFDAREIIGGAVSLPLR